MFHFVTTTASYRPTTEDRIAVFSVQDGWIVCVADGVGGMPGGAKAAELFVSGIARAARTHGFDMAEPATWIALLEILDNEIARDPLAGETTGVALGITSGSVVGASCGNSRAYLSKQADWQELTRLQFLRPRLGSGRARGRSFGADAHGTLVVATDGLFDYVRMEGIPPAFLREAASAGDALVRLVLDQHRHLPDDIAIVVGWLD
jgi:serine/threonine protein phosphatase PrpC